VTRPLFATLILLPAVALAQFNPGPFLEPGFRELHARGLLPEQPAPLPTELTGHPGLPPREGTIPEPVAEDDLFVLEHADRSSQVGNVVRLEGNVRFRVRGYQVTADAAEGDLTTQIFTLSGNVQVTGTEVVVWGRQVTVDFPNRSYRAEDAQSQLSPGLVGGNVRDPLYVSGRQSFGTEAETRTIDGAFTTCNLDHPHYEIRGGEVVVRPGRRAIFRNLSLHALGRTLLRLPFLSVPLDDRTYRYLPDVGQSPDEGFYAKTRWGVPLRGVGNNLDARLDYMTRLGPGLGGDFDYAGALLAGVARVYFMPERNAWAIDAQHRQTLPFGLLTLNNVFQQNHHMGTPGASTLNSRAQLTIPQGRTATTNLGFFRMGSDGTGFNSVNQNLNLNDQRQFGARTRTSLDLNWADSRTAFAEGEGIRREQLEVRFRGQHELRQATALLEYQRSIPIGQIQNFFGASDRTPVLALQSDARRLFGPRVADVIPFQTELSVGEYSNPLDRNRIGRGAFDLRFQRPIPRAPGRFRWDASGRFRQAFYSDDTAQYLLNLNTALSYRLGRDTAANVRYNYLRPYGFSPLILDRTGTTNIVTSDVSVRPLPDLFVGVQTGFDIQRHDRGQIGWQHLGIRSEYRPAPNLMFRGLSTYDTQRQVWSNTRLDMTFQPGETSISVGLRYDGLRHTWAGANLFLDNLRIGRLSMSAILAYNGYQRRFEAQQYAFIYDLHCFEAVLQISDYGFGFRSGTQVNFFLRLKALPFDPYFGTGTQGEPIGIGIGRDF
jgi:hypothetical protein